MLLVRVVLLLFSCIIICKNKKLKQCYSQVVLMIFQGIMHCGRCICLISECYSTGSKHSKFRDRHYCLQKLIYVILHILCCTRIDNIILRLFLSSLLENESTATVNLRSAKFTVSCGTLYTLYTIHIYRNASSFR